MSPFRFAPLPALLVLVEVASKARAAGLPGAKKTVDTELLKSKNKPVSVPTKVEVGARPTVTFTPPVVSSMVTVGVTLLGLSL